MAGDDIDFIAFEGATQSRRRLALDDALAQLCGHLVNIIFVQIKFLGDLLVGEVEPHQIQTENPLAQGLVMTGKDGVGQVIKIAVTGMAMIALTMALVIITTPLGHRRRVTPDAMKAVRPTQLADSFIALGIINEVINLQHKRSLLDWNPFFKEPWRVFQDLPDSAIEP